MQFLPIAIAALSMMSDGGSGSSSSKHGGGLQSPKDLKKVKNFDKYQKAAEKALAKGKGFDIKQEPLYGQGAAYLQNMLSQNPQAYKDFEKPYMEQFNQEIAPGIANRFAGEENLNSSAFNNSMAQASRSLSERLAALRSGLQMQALPQALNFAQAPMQNKMSQTQTLLGSQPFSYFQPGQPAQQQPSAWSNFIGGLAPGAGYGMVQSMFGGGGGGGWFGNSGKLGQKQTWSDYGSLYGPQPVV